MKQKIFTNQIDQNMQQLRAILAKLPHEVSEINSQPCITIADTFLDPRDWRTLIHADETPAIATKRGGK